MSSTTHRAAHMLGAPVHTPTARLTEALADISESDPITVYGALELYGPRAVSTLLATERARISWRRVGASIVPTLAKVA